MEQKLQDVIAEAKQVGLTSADLCECIIVGTKEKQQQNRKQELCHNIKTQLWENTWDSGARDDASVLVTNMVKTYEELTWFAQEDAFVGDFLHTNGMEIYFEGPQCFVKHQLNL